MKKVRECVAKCITILTILNLVSWLVGGNVVVMAKCEDTDKCSHGYHSFDDYYLKTGGGGKHGTRYVYVSTKFKSEINKRQVMMGYCAWNMSGNNKVRLANTTDYDKRQIYIVPEVLGVGVYGLTYLKIKTGDAYITSEDIDKRLRNNYKYVKIEIHEAKCQRENLLTKTVLHESGHALGLSHVTCKKSAMCPGMDSLNMLANPSDADRSTLRHVYNAYK